MNDARCNQCDHYAKELIFYEGLTVNMKDEIVKLRSERDALRELLWLNHGQYLSYGHAPYGDDGEKQCCGIDFKRWSVEEIQAHLDRRLHAE